ncbi:MAG: CYTH and CHAD domain-containing protein [Acidimicrobiales bacterium]
MGGAEVATDDVEVEWQFDAIDLRPVERWLTDPSRRGTGLDDFDVSAGEGFRQVDQYLDTEDWRIGRAGLTLRVRQTGHGDEITLKDRGSLAADGLRRRLEVTEPLPGAGVAALGRTGPVGWRVAAVAARRPLHEVLEVRTRRLPFVLSLGGAPVAEIALDDTVIGAEGDEQPARLRRVEIEARPGAEASVEPLVAALRQACSLQPAVLSKFEAGLLSLGLEIPGPPDLGPTEVGGDASMTDLARSVVRRHLGAMLAREAGTRLGEDIEELHDMRVATRRLRAALALFADALPATAPPLREELKWVAQVLGRVRDLDVQLERFTDMARRPDGHDRGDDPLRELRDLLAEERTSARAALIDALESPRWERLVDQLRDVATGSEEPVGPGAVPALLAVPALVLSRHRAAERAAHRAVRTGKASDFHRLRIRCKWLRYCLEFTTDLYGEGTRRFVRRLARLQDGLGLLQDAEVAIERLAALAERDGGRLPPRTIFAIGAMAERYRSEGERLLAELPGRVRVLGHKEWADVARAMERRRVHEMAATSTDDVGPAEDVPWPGPGADPTVVPAANGHLPPSAAAPPADVPAGERPLRPPPAFVAAATGDVPARPAVNGTVGDHDATVGSPGDWPEVSWGLPGSA